MHNNNYFYIFVVVLLSCSNSLVYAMEQDEKEQLFYSIVVPDVNNSGGESYKGNNIINTPSYKVYNSLGYGNRRSFGDLMKIDLGQRNCVQYFEEQFEPDLQSHQSTNTKLLLYGIGQGCPTLVNWLTKLPAEKQKQLVGCLMLESMIGSGNSSILHSAQSNTKTLTYLPFARYWLPWAAKALCYPYYNPRGPQLLTSLNKLSPDIPVVIKHNVSDPDFSINDARQAYCVLLGNNNFNAYLLETHGTQKAHFNVLNVDPEKKEKLSAIQKIYKRHHLPYNKKAKKNASHVELKGFQPALQDVQYKIELSTRGNENIRDSIDLTAIAIGSGLACAGVLNYCK